MKKCLLPMLLILLTITSFSQSKFPKNEISINGFRNPSVGLEYRHNRVSVHTGYYTTAFKAGEYTGFVKTGFTYWMIPLDNKKIPSSFYAGASYLRGLNGDYNKQDALAVETGFRWFIVKGLNARLGVIGVVAKERDVKINPTPGISYSFTF